MKSFFTFIVTWTAKIFRWDAFGRIINSGLVNTSPAGNALRMIGGGILGRAITSAFTNNSFLKGLGTGFGAVSAISKW